MSAPAAARSPIPGRCPCRVAGDGEDLLPRPAQPGAVALGVGGEGAGHLVRVVADAGEGEHRQGVAGARAALGGEGAYMLQVARAVALGDQGAVGDPAGQFQRTGAHHARDHGRDVGRRMHQPHAVQAYFTSRQLHAFPAQQRPHGGDRLLQQGQRGAGRDARLGHPLLYPVSDSGHQPAREHPCQGGQFHGQQRGAAQRGGGDADADPQARGRAQGHGGGRHPGVPAEVLHHPQVVRPEGLGGPREPGQPLRVPVAVVHHADPYVRHGCGTCASVEWVVDGALPGRRRGPVRPVGGASAGGRRAGQSATGRPRPQAQARRSAPDRLVVASQGRSGSPTSFWSEYVSSVRSPGQYTEPIFSSRKVSVTAWT